MSKNHIALTFDDNYIEPAIVMMTSVLANKKDEDTIDFHILDGGLSENSKKYLNNMKNCIIEYHKVDTELFKGYKKSQYYSVSVLWRLLLPNMLPNLDKLLFLDVDLIVNSSLFELWNIDLDDNYIVAVEDPNGKKYAKRQNFNKNDKYFNAGVMLINCKKWRENSIPEKSIKIAIDNIGKPLCCDQTILNILFEGKVKFVDLKWNLQYSPINIWATYEDKIQYKQAIENPAIIHFTGDFKPWKIGYGCFNPYREKYFEYHKKTAFALSSYKDLDALDKSQWYRGLFAFIKRYPLFFLRRRFWLNFLYVAKLNMIKI